MNDPASRIRRSLAVSIERALHAALAEGRGDGGGPPGLQRAMEYAVFPGGARLRPRLCLTVACACGDDNRGLADAAAAAIELLHCASLVHDDLPCFDDAATRRGRPTVHAAYGEELAVLAGDGLIVAAFEVLARGAVHAPLRLAPMIAALAQGTGAPRGIVAGQGWESEPTVDVAAYHRAKTGALFSAAASLAALSAGADPAPWAALGGRLGEAYQLADDLADVLSESTRLGKGTGVDATHDRPSAVRAHGVHGALARLEAALTEVLHAVPDGPRAAELHTLLVHAGLHLVPSSLRGRLALPHRRPVASEGPIGLVG